MPTALTQAINALTTVLLRNAAASFFLLALTFRCNAAVSEPINAPAQERIAALIQKVLGSYREESDATNSLPSAGLILTNIEKNLREASTLMPERLDLRFGIATALIGQALQTNAPFATKMQNALTIYREISSLDLNGFQAPVLFAAYSRAIGSTNEAETILAELSKKHPAQTEGYREGFRRVDQILQMPLNYETDWLASTNADHAIVILGAGLQTNATMKPKLLARLEQGFKLAHALPNAAIVVTGGNPVLGVTEAFVMSNWLAAQGVARNRVYLEDKAGDTVGNAFRSCAILQKLGVRSATLVTSESHMRRALLTFREAALQRGLRLELSHLVAPDQPDLDAERDRVALYRDFMRSSGIWSFPGIQR